MSPEERLKKVEEAWFDYAFADTAAQTPEEHIEAAEEFARRVGDAVFSGVEPEPWMVDAPPAPRHEGRCERPPCEKCPDWPMYCMTRHYSKAMTEDQWAEELALLAAEREDEIGGQIAPDSRGHAVLIVNIPHSKECAACGMDDSMQPNLVLCETCHKCVYWEDEFGKGWCCTCPKSGEQS